ncbi:MAG: hypothetical protein FVQ80_14100 [Planctomycetes bacterium]|nr:hypothetical protein [Planctomycetota bacterium]
MIQKKNRTEYEKKFADFIRLCKESKEKHMETVVVAFPQVLGDNYAEIVESLNRLSEAELSLSIVPPKASGK